MKPSPFTFDTRADTVLILRNPNAAQKEECEIQTDSEPEYERLNEAGFGTSNKTRRDSPMTLDNDQKYPRGSLEDTQVEFRVSSRHMSLASPVFRAMLESKFKESQLNEQGLYEVQASEWDAEAFVILLDIIHGHNRDVPKRISVETLSQIAIIVDYYGCHEIMELSDEADATTWPGNGQTSRTIRWMDSREGEKNNSWFGSAALACPWQIYGSSVHFEQGVGSEG
ncbi:hypothetical protein NW768_008195 [Fusarium equiseti]|uniref:BTB domain-containing protein n=1 Tax=Fusarium equiseti TaxID=61235 RepID=A0ABQ8R6E7_FUSEQ|nr:hypothetical protein NW768_008195 [Fusarium equiseti]